MEEKVLKANELSNPDNFNMANEAAKTANVDIEHLSPRSGNLTTQPKSVPLASPTYAWWWVIT